MLLKQGRLDEFQLRSALGHQRRWGGRIGEAVVSLGFLSEKEVLETVARQLGIPFVHIGPDRYVAPAVLSRVPEKLARARKVFPLAMASHGRRGPLLVATAAPQDLHALDEVAFASGLAVSPALASPRDIERAVDRCYGGGLPARDAVELPPDAVGPMRVIPFAHGVR
jgi:type IV pilus assembly protein PilB